MPSLSFLTWMMEQKRLSHEVVLRLQQDGEQKLFCARVHVGTRGRVTSSQEEKGRSKAWVRRETPTEQTLCCVCRAWNSVMCMGTWPSSQRLTTSKHGVSGATPDQSKGLERCGLTRALPPSLLLSQCLHGSLLPRTLVCCPLQLAIVRREP